MQDKARRPGYPVILVAMPTSEKMLEVHEGLASELEDDFDLVTFQVDASTPSSLLAEAIKRERPACLVLMNNQTVRKYRDVQGVAPDGVFPPAVVLMTSFLEQEITRLRNATGIAYEVPGVSAFVQLRGILERDVKRIGVLYRERLGDFVKNQRRIAAREKFELVAYKVSSSVSNDEIVAGVGDLVSEGRIDTLWILNDNALLTPSLLMKGWQTAITSGGVPVIVNVEPLVHPSARLGTFGVVPDHKALGVQAANKIFELQDEDWTVEENQVDLPLSVETVLKVREARDAFQLKSSVLGQVNRLVE